MRQGGFAAAGASVSAGSALLTGLLVAQRTHHLAVVPGGDLPPQIRVFVPVTPKDRLAEFYVRLDKTPAAATGVETRARLAEILVQVENELSGLPNLPGTEGRMFPPQDDSRRAVPGWPDVVRFRAMKHHVLIRANGALEIRRAVPGTDVAACPV